MKKMYPTTPILTTANDPKSIASMNIGRLLRNAYLTSRDEYPSSLLPYNPGLGDTWISSIYQHDYAMQFIKGSKVTRCVISPIAKVNYWDGIFRTDSLIIRMSEVSDQQKATFWSDFRLSIPASIYILAVISIQSLIRYAEDENSLSDTNTIKEIVAEIVRNGEAEYYAVGCHQYTKFYKEPDICDIYIPRFWPLRVWLSVENELSKLLDALSPIIFDLVIKANAQYPIRKLRLKYGECYYNNSEFVNKLLEDTKFYKIDEYGGYIYNIDNKYFIMIDIFKIRIKCQ